MRGREVERELPEPRPEEEQVRDLEGKVEEIRGEANEQLRQITREISTRAGQSTIVIVDLSFRLPAVDRAFSGERARDRSRETVREESEADREEKAVKDRAVEDTLREATETEDPHDPDSDKKAKEKKESGLRKLLGLGVLAVFSSELLPVFESLVQAFDGKKIDESIIKDRKHREVLRAIIEKLRDESDEVFWTRIAKMVDDEPKTTLAELVYYMQFIMLLSPRENAFVWKNWSEESTEVEKLITLYNENKNEPKSAVIKALPAVMQDSTPAPPRYIQASLGQLVFGNVVQRKPKLE